MALQVVILGAEREVVEAAVEEVGTGAWRVVETLHRPARPAKVHSRCSTPIAHMEVLTAPGNGRNILSFRALAAPH